MVAAYWKKSLRFLVLHIYVNFDPRAHKQGGGNSSKEINVQRKQMASCWASKNVAKSKRLENSKSGGFLCCAYKIWWSQNGSPRLQTHKGARFCVGSFFRAHEPVKRCLKSAMFTLKMKILIAFKQIQQISQLINN